MKPLPFCLLSVGLITPSNVIMTSEKKEVCAEKTSVIVIDRLAYSMMQLLNIYSPTLTVHFVVSGTYTISGHEI